MNGNTYLFLAALLVVACVATIKTFGQTVSTKFSPANQGVTSDITFGGSNTSSSWAGSRPSTRRAASLDSDMPTLPPPVRTTAITEPPSIKANPIESPELDRLSTFALDVDTGSYTLMRATVKSGSVPRDNTVRVEEYVNYFKYSYPQPKMGAIGVHLEAAPSPFAADRNTYLLRIGVQAKTLQKSDKVPNHLTFLIDVSGSMQDPRKLPLIKNALRQLVRNMGNRDTVAIVTYASASQVQLKRTSARNKQTIMRAIDSLRAGGATSMSNGMTLAYQVAFEEMDSRHNNRVIVLSDGDANIGNGNHEEILQNIEYYVAEGITMSTIGFGMGNYRDNLMEQLADHGHGNYYYVDSADEAHKVFGAQIDGTLHVVAKDVKVQVDFDPEFITSYRLIGYENRSLEDHEFADDDVHGGDIGAGHTVTALYEVVLAGPPRAAMATVYVRAKHPRDNTSVEQAYPLNKRHFRATLQDASSDYMFAAAVAGFAEILRSSPHADGLSLDLILEVAQAATKRQPDRLEFIQLVKKVARIRLG